MAAAIPQVLQVNPNPCTPEEERQNWGSVAHVLNNFIEIINTGTTSDHKVAINVAGALSYDYLHAKINDHGTYNADLHALVFSEEIADTTVRLVAQLDGMSGFAASSGGKVLSLNAAADLISWQDAGSVTDNFTVKCSGVDTTADYLHTKFSLNAAYVPDADILIATETVDAAAGYLKERPFVQVSIIPGWSATEFRMLGLKGNETGYKSIDQFWAEHTLIDLVYSSGVLFNPGKVRSTINDTTSAYLHDAVKDVTTYAAGDIIISASTDGAASTDQKERFVIDVSVVPGYSAAGTRLLALVDNVFTMVAPSSATETFRLVRGEAVGAVLAGAASFSIDNIVRLAGSAAPSDPLVVQNTKKQAFANDEIVTAIYRADTDNWQVLPVERFRSLRGNWYAGTATLSVKAIEPLASGIDPRFDTTDVDEIVSVYNPHGDSYSTGDKVEADWNVKENRWEARRKTAVAEKYRALRGKCVGSVSAAPTTFNIYNVSILDSGQDPRSDPSSSIETVSIYNYPAEAHDADDEVYADFNEFYNRLEKRPKAGTGGGDWRYILIESDIDAATGPSATFTPATATVKYYLRAVSGDYELALDEDDDPLTMDVEWGEHAAFTRAPSTAKYRGIAIKNPDGYWTIDVIFCAPIVEES